MAVRRVKTHLAGPSPRRPPPLPPTALPTSEVVASQPAMLRRGFWRRWIDETFLQPSSWLVSLLVHLAILLALGLVVVTPREIPRSLLLTFSESAPEELLLETSPLETSSDPETPDSAPLLETDVPPPAIEVPTVALPTIPVVVEAAVVPAGENTVTEPTSGATPDAFGGRAGRRGTALQNGATAGSEEAVDRALVWLAAHQQSSGQWSFDLRDCGCDGACSHRGSGMRAINGATALALLPFLGAGQTHEQGYHRTTIEAGLKYLMAQQGGNGGFLEDQGTMYSHGLATLVLCESLAMTRTDPGRPASSYRKQPELRRSAQRAIDYLLRHQHPGGGWRYVPGDKGDTSVVGWQAMALQSGKMAGLKVPKRNLERISRFLDSVQADDYGAEYGYLNNVSRPGTSAIGLLSRMYLGWDRTHPGISNGAEYLDRLGPSANNVYFNYYATQVLHHYSGPIWERWHPLLRDHLVDTQARDGHETGSWYFENDFGSIVGGRLYITAMSTMILEVYYRHMPIYSESAIAKIQD